MCVKWKKIVESTGWIRLQIIWRRRTIDEQEQGKEPEHYSNFNFRVY